jgi:hypothetical protein
LTWHVHGSYLYYLTQTPVEFYLPVKDGKPEGYGGRSGTIPWGDNVHDVAADAVKDLDFDVVLYQSHKNYLEDQYEILTDEQRKKPRLFLEHNPPRVHPVSTKHPVADTDVLIVHVTHFNNLMWDNNGCSTQVIEHGVLVPEGMRYTGELDKGIVVVNGLPSRDRLRGRDVFEYVRAEIPLDIIGMESEQVGGLGEIPLNDLHSVISKYRFFFNPLRYTSLGLAVCEAMMIGMPIVGLATTEMPVVITNGVNGYVHTDVDFLIERMKELLTTKERAVAISNGARMYASEKFNIVRYQKSYRLQ